MFAKEQTYCKQVFKKWGIKAPEVRIETAWTLLSHMDTSMETTFWLGILTRLRRQTKRSALHESIHILTDQYPRLDEYLEPFGNEDMWDAEQNMIRWITHGNEHITRYAATHPDEDFVETCIAVLTAQPIPPHYDARATAVKLWLKDVRQEQTRYDD